MPTRYIPLVTNQYYHVYNRGVARQPIFYTKRDYKRFINIFNYYAFINIPIRYSRYLALPSDDRIKILNKLQREDKRHVHVSCFVLMPNHFHFLLQQLEDNGVSKFLKEIQNSSTRYMNTKNNRIGTLFQGQFKAKRIESDEQLLQVNRYIHLNPYTSYIVKSIEDLIYYPWSSLHNYINNPSTLKNKDIDLNPDNYWKFITDYAEYKRELNNINHLVFDE